LWLGRIEDQTYHVYVYGAVYYSDVFKHWHETGVCGWYDPSPSYNTSLFLTACSGAGTDYLD
jgi:hypothetical protein